MWMMIVTRACRHTDSQCPQHPVVREAGCQFGRDGFKDRAAGSGEPRNVLCLRRAHPLHLSCPCRNGKDHVASVRTGEGKGQVKRAEVRRGQCVDPAVMTGMT